MEARPTDSGETHSTLVNAPVREPSSGCNDDQTPSGDQVLEFLQDLRFDRRRCRNLNSGRNLLLEAAEAGLVEPGELDLFVARMSQLHEAGLVGWTSARHDLQGDDLPHAAEFHVTEQGRHRLAATDDRRGLAASPGHVGALAGGVGRA